MDSTSTVLIHADIIDDTAKEQIANISKSPAIQGLISIMPDVHAGEGCVIGFTGRFNHAVIPNIVGVDIGCGVAAHCIGQQEINFKEFDEYVRKNIPLGFSSRNADKDLMPFLKDTELIVDYEEITAAASTFFYDNSVPVSTAPKNQIGTLGGGNHFIEIDQDNNGMKWLIVHSGSRNFGLKVANFYQAKASKICKDMLLNLPKGLDYLPFDYGGDEYLEWLHVAQQYAQLNRRMMLEIMLKYFNQYYDEKCIVESVHNFISPLDKIIRKGAISARENEKVIIPLNMAEGCIIGIGKGRAEYNNSAPHGAGRLTGRKEMHRQLESGKITMDAFKESMNGVFSTSVKESTIDESPFAYKKYESIEKHVNETVDVTTIMKPVYNLKSDEQ